MERDKYSVIVLKVATEIFYWKQVCLLTVKTFSNQKPFFIHLASIYLHTLITATTTTTTITTTTTTITTTKEQQQQQQRQQRRRQRQQRQQQQQQQQK